MTVGFSEIMLSIQVVLQVNISKAINISLRTVFYTFSVPTPRPHHGI